MEYKLSEHQLISALKQIVRGIFSSVQFPCGVGLTLGSVCFL